MKLKIFTSAKCNPCKLAIDYLKKENIKFEELTVDTDENNMLIRKYHICTVPSLVVDEDTVIEGFSPKSYSKIRRAT